jgi:hypothetical protein
MLLCGLLASSLAGCSGLAARTGATGLTPDKLDSLKKAATLLSTN